MNQPTPAAAFEIELTVFARLPLKLGPFHTSASQDELAAELVALFEGLPCRLDGLDYQDHNAAPHVEQLPPWRGRATLLAHGLRPKPRGEPFTVEDVPLLRSLLAFRFCDYQQGRWHSSKGAVFAMEPGPLAWLMQDRLESPHLEREGGEQGGREVLALYMAMTGGSGLTPVGFETLCMMLEGFAEQVAKKGEDQEPSALVCH
ncbi:hypothetical protein [Oceanisphaera arctica]|uniref:Uncharacterized protein n=1 Tax=Oceanisphaera arctica TaxID=641510 RepID=A0A2P5TN52_9GAMM|nr:hypothetical protein [Oceanisphaera arctica]PPL16979.1 hypothetical protein UN63_06535 [Oceanisphaera arctica]GHA07717.1 hypothetical protein GCM10007082_05740 [Oceanisphaera arctica]